VWSITQPSEREGVVSRKLGEGGGAGCQSGLCLIWFIVVIVAAGLPKIQQELDLIRSIAQEGFNASLVWRLWKIVWEGGGGLRMA